MLLVEAAQNYARGQVGCKSSCLVARQKGNAPAVIEYADKANERLRRKYDRLTLKNGKKANVAKTAVARRRTRIRTTKYCSERLIAGYCMDMGTASKVKTDVLKLCNI